MKPIISRLIKACLFCVFLSLLAFISRRDEPIDKLVTSLQRWTDSIPQEKVYLHMDKPYYALGDTIWFKGYLTIGSRHQLSALSGAMYVELITEKDSLVQQLKLPVTSGMVMGDFILSDELKEGSYRIRAYTQWMRNAGSDYFYDHTFTVGDIDNSNIITRADYQYKAVNGKPVLTATLNYMDNDGKPLGGKNVHYQIMIDKKIAWSTTARTDAQGNIPVKISNENHIDLSGAYITTTLYGSDKRAITKDFPIKAMLSQSDVQFFPESGNLVNGISSRIAFKAIGIDGLGLDIKGTVTDNENKKLAEFTTLHAGMGSFLLKAEPNKTYTANITFADGTTKAIPLPKATDEGYVLSVYQPNKDSILVRIHASPKNQNSSISLVAHTNGEVIFAAPVKIANALTSVWLQKKLFPTGIAQFTIFDTNNEPLNERIAFIRNDDRMQLTLKTSKNTYSSKEPVLADMEVKDSKGKPTAGNFSVAVIDESKVPVDESAESTILSNLLLTSDLKGYVEKPNYYFIKENDEETDKALDNLMLTQGYRRFTWKELNNITSSKTAFPVEGLNSTISGTVTTLGLKPLPNANVMLLSLRAKIAKSSVTDANGKFKFDGLFIVDSTKFAVQARSNKNSNKVIIAIDKIAMMKMTPNQNLPDVSTDISKTLKTYINSGKNDDDIYERLGKLDQVHRLREVKIRAKKNAAPTYSAQGVFQIPEGSSDQTLVIKDPEQCATLGICLQGELPGIVFQSYDFIEDKVPYHYNNYPFCHYYGKTTPMSLVVDGVLMQKKHDVGDVFDDNIIEPENIAKIEIVRSNQALISMLGGGPVIMIYTKRGFIRTAYNPSMANIVPKAYNKVREFYSPRYTPGKENKLPDLRTTVYWNPYLKTGESGKTSFSFFNADGPGTYKVVVEGINADGQIGRQVYKYRVE